MGRGGGEYKLLFMVKFSLVEYYVYEKFDAYLVDNFYFIFISDVGVCKFWRKCMLLVCMAPLTPMLIIIQFLSRKSGETLWMKPPFPIPKTLKFF